MTAVSRERSRKETPRATGAQLPSGPMPGGPLPIEFRTLRVGMRVTLLAPLAAAAMFLLAMRTRVDLGAYGLIFTVLAVAVARSPMAVI